MHHHLEVILPPSDDVSASVKQILAPFDENGDEGDENHSPRHVFWDYWRIGGRWSGQKLLAMLGNNKVDAFHKLLSERHVTVSGLRWGKPTLQPADQRCLVDALWAEAFPEAPVKECPLFDYYEDDAGDVILLCDTPKALVCSHVIIAGPDYLGERLQAKHMLKDSIWNGVTYQDTTWDRTIGGALQDFESRLGSHQPEYAEKMRPTDNWFCVTVDYHS